MNDIGAIENMVYAVNILDEFGGQIDVDFIIRYSIVPDPNHEVG